MTELNFHNPRSVLFVPASNPNLAPKAAISDADVICIDLEDGVAPEIKPQARKNLDDIALTLHKAGKIIWLRINSDAVDYAKDLAALPLQIDAVVLPKAQDFTHIQKLEDTLSAFRNIPIAIIAMIEDPRAIEVFSQQCLLPVPRSLAAIALGTEDLSMELCVEPNSDLIRAYFHRVLQFSAAMSRPVLGYAGSIAEFCDLNKFYQVACDAKAVGATGGFCIHPKQVSMLNRAFAFSQVQIEWAERAVEAFDQSQSGLVHINGQMIDLPVYLRAKSILRKS